MMPADPASLAALCLLILLAAVLYSSVGHAGASAYLAVLALFGVPAPETRPAALVMNVLVASVGTARFASAGLVPWRLLVPLCLGSVPAAFLGGRVALPLGVHRIALGVVILVGAARLLLPDRAGRRRDAPGGPALAAIGAGIGVAAGLTGVGGGIFLSPLLILTGWAEVKRAAGASVVFILANSIAGLAGLLSAGGGVPPSTAWLAAVALCGGFYGSWLGARRLPAATLRRLLALVLVVAGLKLLLA